MNTINCGFCNKILICDLAGIYRCNDIHHTHYIYTKEKIYYDPHHPNNEEILEEYLRLGKCIIHIIKNECIFYEFFKGSIHTRKIKSSCLIKLYKSGNYELNSFIETIQKKLQQ